MKPLHLRETGFLVSNLVLAGSINMDQRTFLLKTATSACAQRKIRADSLVSVTCFYSALFSSRSAFVDYEQEHSLGLKQPGREAGHHLILSLTKVTNVRNFNSTTQYVFIE